MTGKCRRIPIELREALVARERGAGAVKRMVVILDWRAKDGVDRIADVTIDKAPLRLDDIAHGRQIVVHQLDEPGRREAFRESREALEVGEQDSHRLDFAAELGKALGLDHAIDDGRRQIECETAAQKPPGAVGDGKKIAEQGRKRQRASWRHGEQRQDQPVCECHRRQTDPEKNGHDEYAAGSERR